MTFLLAVMLMSSVQKEAWGTTAGGEPVAVYTLTSSTISARIATYGARLISLSAPDRKGAKADVVLGYGDLASYEKDRSTYFGAVVGRYGNRIARGRFEIAGVAYQVPVNNNGQALHGGPEGFDRKVWSAKEVKNGVELALVSPDGDMGFPGELTLSVRYTLVGNALRIDYTAVTTKTTVVNVTNHAYFNLAGTGTILGHELTIPAERYTPIDAVLIPTGALPNVQDTPMDFRRATTIGSRLTKPFEQLTIAHGYDHNFVLDNAKAEHLAAEAYDPASGRALRVTTTEPGVQFYSGNFLDGSNGFVRNAGFCLETQHFPDSPNQGSFPSTVLEPGKTFRSTTTFTFGVRK